MISLLFRHVLPSIKDFFKKAVSADNLLTAWTQLKSNPGMLTCADTSETFHKINRKWFEDASQALIKGEYKYPNRRRIWIPKPGKSTKRPLTISNPRVKVIEKALLNSLEPYFEGVWDWSKSSEKDLISTLILRNESTHACPHSLYLG